LISIPQGVVDDHDPANKLAFIAFAEAYGLDGAMLNRDIFTTLSNLRTVLDVFQCPLFNENHGRSILRSLRSAIGTGRPRHWLTSNLTSPLVVENRVYVHFEFLIGKDKSVTFVGLVDPVAIAGMTEQMTFA
jgi:hypothetical protein